MKSRFIFIGSTIVLLVCFNCKKEKVVIANPLYAIGTIIYWQHPPSNVAKIEFQYYGGGSLTVIGYDNQQFGWTVPNSGNYQGGDKFMVQFDPNNLEHARMLFDYPVKDTTDYLNDVNQFKNHPPSCCLIHVYH